MATITAAWTENQTDVDFADTTPADNVQTKADFDLASNGYDMLVVQLELDWHASATDYADINLYSSPDSGTTDDNVPLWTQRVDADAGNTTYITIVIQDLAYAIIEFDNQTNQEMTVIDINYAGRKWSSA